MSEVSWNSIKDVVDSVLEIPPEQRASYLDQHCPDPQIRRSVEALLESYEASAAFFREPAIVDHLHDDASWIGQRVGSYKILEEVGAGGMGVVYRAARADDEFSQHVAVKVVGGILASKAHLERFRIERQILADLSHPNIARLLDGGTTSEGLPFLVMEFIEGRPINQYCDDRQLSLRQRLELFLQVCAAVQYAHQNFVVHRDLKPGNILVTEDVTPKLLDFGIAKILQPTGVAPEATLAAMRVMTPEYASPEQLEGRPLTTASDVYSLGVVLYSLLTWNWPYLADSRTPSDIARAVANQAPRRPSTAIADVAKNRAGDESSRTPLACESLASMQKQLAGDLDAIMLKSLDRDPGRRYSSVEQFAADIRRYLDGRPVEARLPTLWYRAAKFARRNALAVSSAAVVAIAAIIAVGWIARAERTANRQRARAEHRFNDVRTLANSLIFNIHDSIRSLPGATSARKLIVQEGLQYLDSLSGESADDPGLQKELAAAYMKLGDVQADAGLGNVGNVAGGIASYRKAVTLREGLARQFPSDLTLQRALSQTYQTLANALFAAGQQTEGDQYLEKALQLAKSIADEHPKDPRILLNLGIVEWQRGVSLDEQNKIDDALQAYRESADSYSRVLALDPSNSSARRDLAIAYKNIGGDLEELKMLADALSNYRLASNIDLQAMQREPENVIPMRDATIDLRNIGGILVKQGKYNEARKNYQSAITMDQRMVEQDRADRDTQAYLAFDYEGMGKALTGMGNRSVAIAYLQNALKILEERVKADPADADDKNALADSYVLLGDTYATQAVKHSHATTSVQNTCSAYNSALALWNDLHKDGKLNKFYETRRTSLIAKMTTCR